MATVRKPEPFDDLQDRSEVLSARVPRLRVLPENPASAPSQARPESHGGEVAWHAMSIDEVVERLSTDQAQGLWAGEAWQRLMQVGPNIVESSDGEERLPWWRTITWGMPSWHGSRGTRPRR